MFRLSACCLFCGTVHVPWVHTHPVKDVGAPTLCTPLLLLTIWPPVRNLSTSSYTCQDMGSCLLYPTLAALAVCRLLPEPHREAVASALGRDCNACGVTTSSVKTGADCCCFHSEMPLLLISLLLLCLVFRLTHLFLKSLCNYLVSAQTRWWSSSLNRLFRKVETCDHTHT